MINYKGETIKLDDNTGIFSWSDVKSTNLLEVKKAIDVIQKQNIRRNAILRENFNGDYKIVTITSRADTTHFWVVREDGHRSKEHISWLYVDTDENKKSIKEIDNIERQIKELSEKSSDLEKSLVHLKIEKIDNA